MFLRYPFRMNADANREGFQIFRKEPVLFPMELLWRWSFGLGLLALSFFAYSHLRQAVLLSDADELAFKSQDPFALAAAVEGVLISIMPLLVRTLVQVFSVAAVFWIASAALGRGVITRLIVRRLAADYGVHVAQDSPRWASFAILKFARVLMLLILFIGYMGGLLLARLVSQDLLIAGSVVFFAFTIACLVWAYVNQVLSLAPIFVVRDALSPLDAIVESIAFIRRHYARIFSISVRNSTIRGVAVTLISIAGIATAGARAFLPAWSVTALLTMETLLYFVISDAFLLLRFAAYASVAVRELILPQELTAQPNSSGTMAL